MGCGRGRWDRVDLEGEGEMWVANMISLCAGGGGELSVPRDMTAHPRAHRVGLQHSKTSVEASERLASVTGYRRRPPLYYR